MKQMQKNNEMDTKAKSFLSIFLLLIIGTIIGAVISRVTLRIIQNRVGTGELITKYWPTFSNNYTLVTIIICMNITLLIGLLIIYINSFQETKSSFLLGLILFLSVLFAQSLLSLPVLDLIISISSTSPYIGFSYIVLNYQSIIFPILANMFETIALIILFYLSME